MVDVASTKSGPQYLLRFQCTLTGSIRLSVNKIYSRMYKVSSSVAVEINARNVCHK